MTVTITGLTSMSNIVSASDVFSFRTPAVRAIAIEALRANLEVHSDIIACERGESGMPPSMHDIKADLENYRETTKEMALTFLDDLKAMVIKALDQVEFQVYVRRMDFDRDTNVSDIVLELDVKPDSIRL